ncbi:MAG: putative tributyrin esterase, partial [Actinoplanes sp.]|nr:putative tributyrin esterase [Actinoplanes sp.]
MPASRSRPGHGVAAGGRPGPAALPYIVETGVMALIRCDFFSEVLELGTSMTVLLPQEPAAGPPPVLYLLHGQTDDHTAWTRNTSIERYAAVR